MTDDAETEPETATFAVVAPPPVMVIFKGP